MLDFFNKYKYILILVLLLNPITIYGLNYPEVNSKVVEVYDLTDNKIIYEVDSNKKEAIASLTKIATTITAIENINDLDKKITITDEMMRSVNPEASKAGLKSGDKLSYKDLLYASMLPSGADATNSIAIASTGSIDTFVEMMNELAGKLKLKNTHFSNVTGLDEKNHYSTADDVRILLSYALKNSLFREIYSTREYTLSNRLTVKSTVIKYNSNSKLNTDKILGSKTGFTNDAGYCLASLSNINSHEFIVIVLGADHIGNDYYNFVDTVKLINFLLKHYKEQVLVEKREVVKTIPVELSKTDKFEVKAGEEVTKYLPSDYDKSKFKIKYEGLEKLSFTNKPDKKIGTISYYYDNEKLDQENVVLDQKLKISFKKIFNRYYYLIIGIPLLIIILIILRKRRKKKMK